MTSKDLDNLINEFTTADPVTNKRVDSENEHVLKANASRCTCTCTKPRFLRTFVHRTCFLHCYSYMYMYGL